MPTEPTAASTPAQTTAAKKTAAKKTAAKKAPAKKAPAKKAPAKGGPAESSSEGRVQKPQGRLRASQVAAHAAAHLADLTGHQAEGVIGLERTDEGWKVQVEVLELRRIPATTDVLASYEVTVDLAGDLVGYRRMHRYIRGAAGEGDR